MTAADFITKALEFIGIPEEYLYYVSYQKHSNSVHLQGEYKSTLVSDMAFKGFSARVESNGFVVFEINKTETTPNIRLVMT
jgi:hypothetical protein